MREIVSCILIIATLSVLMFTMSACSKNELESGTYADLISDKNIIRIDFFSTDLSNTKMSNDDALQISKTWFIISDGPGKIYTRMNSDNLFNGVKQEILDLPYIIATDDNLVFTATSEFIILFLDDESYIIVDFGSQVRYLDKEGNQINSKDKIIYDDNSIENLKIRLKENLTGIPYNSFADYWATLESNQFWM